MAFKRDKFAKKMPFGKHKGMQIRHLPRDYLEWMAKKFLDTDFNEYALLAKEALASKSVREEMSTQRLESAADEILKQAGYNKDGKRRGGADKW
jgi:hypothetical protein